MLYKFFVWRFYSRADRVIAPSQFAADLLYVAGLKKPVSVLSNGVTEAFFLRRDPPAKAPPYHVVSVGRLANEKQQPQLLRAVAASKHSKDIRLTLAGTGPQQTKLAALADQLGVNAKIGRVSDERLNASYQTAHLFVQTSAVELEGMSVLEAMAAGCPVLVNKSSTSAVPEFVTAEEATYAMNDVSELTRKLNAMLDSQSIRAAAAKQIGRLRGGVITRILRNCWHRSIPMFCLLRMACHEHGVCRRRKLRYSGNAWIAWLGRRSGFVLVLATLLSALSLWCFAHYGALNSDLSKLIRPSESLSWYRDNERYKAAFPQFQQSAVIVARSDDYRQLQGPCAGAGRPVAHGYCICSGC